MLGDPDARARLEALPAQDAAFLADFPVDEAVRRIEGRARTGRRAPRQPPGGALGGWRR
ncbi:MAG: hypothetical protein R3F59_02590 [Myxococcota bacterium]